MCVPGWNMFSYGAEKCFLHEVVCAVDFAAERDRKRPQARNGAMPILKSDKRLTCRPAIVLWRPTTYITNTRKHRLARELPKQNGDVPKSSLSANGSMNAAAGRPKYF